jgi:cobalt-zinc-cadmium efflux system outer membrane protein
MRVLNEGREPGRWRTSVLLLLLLFFLPGVSFGQTEPADHPVQGGTLRLDELLALAQRDNARVRAALHLVEASAAREPGAGTLPDPALQVGVMNLALPEFSANMPASMAPTFQLTQRFPIAGKLGLRTELAEQATEGWTAAANEVWWQVRAEVAGAFYRLYQADRQLEVLERTLSLLGDFETVARSLYSAGQGRQADVLRASVEVARMEAEIQRMLAVRRATEATLNGLLNRSSDTPAPSPTLGPLPRELPTPEVLRIWAGETRPLLQESRIEVEEAATRNRLAEKSIWPDISLGVQYGLGRMGGDLKSMGGAMVGFSLPIHSGKRQYRARDEAAAIVRSAQARLEGVSAIVESRIIVELAELDRARTLLALYSDGILPQARATVESALSSYRVGGVDFPTLVDAQMAVNRFQGEYFALIASYGSALAELETTIGRDLPVADELILEER